MDIMWPIRITLQNETEHKKKHKKKVLLNFFKFDVGPRSVVPVCWM